jgi:hypothetical protein
MSAGEVVTHLDRICVCGHEDFDHVVRYYETGNRSPVCQRRGCACSHFTVPNFTIPTAT